MPKALDPQSPEFVNTTLLPAGKYQGRTIAEVATTPDGLFYLDNLTCHPNPPSFLKPQLKRSIVRFMDRPDQQLALKEHSGKRK